MPTPVTAESLFEKLQHVRIGGAVCLYTLDKCREMAPLINQINELKLRKQAVILAHSYVTPEIIQGVADFSGDSYQLAKDARSTDAKIIVFAAVRFMAETAKIMNPEKEVLVPSQPDGCTLADSLTGADVRRLRAENPGFAFLCYINTTAEVKAECDCCVTSSNVYHIVAHYPNDRIFFVPDKLMGINLRDELRRKGVNKEIKIHSGTCYVHEQYDADMVEYIRLQYPGVQVLCHPECAAGVVALADYTGSTSQMIDYVRNSRADTFFLLTECGLSARLMLEFPDKKFVGSCTLCRYMKANTLQDILRVLTAPVPADRAEVPEAVRVRARRCLEAMFRYAGK